MTSNSLFNEKTIQNLAAKVILSSKQKKASQTWIDLIEEGKLIKEKEGYLKFYDIILKELLGYDNISHEKEGVEFSYEKDGKSVLRIEVKGMNTPDLFLPQKREKGESPVEQLWRYMNKFASPYGMVTNYKTFILFKHAVGSSRYYQFDFEDIKDNQNALNKFIAIFSKESLDNGFLEELYEKSIIEEREFTKEFYKLFHETRLMLIKEFEENSNINRGAAVHFAQIFLNRLMFEFFAEDTGKIDKGILEGRILSTLNNINSFSSNSSNISNDLVGLFEDLDKGSDFPIKLFGFNGGLFRHPVPAKIQFRDFRDEKFFKGIYQSSKLKSKGLQLNEKEQEIFNKYKNKISPIIENILLMSSFDFNTEVNVNILGHIFEQSISDIENLKEDNGSRRKKEGIFYTPEYITDYICRNTIIPHLSKNGSNTTTDLIREYSENISELEKKFKQIKIIDPACGSGAFLIKSTDIMLEILKAIQDFKQQEGDYAAQRGLKKKSDFKGQLVLTRWHEEDEAREIIENNIYGVDLNEESIEITKLALFLKMARKNRKLSDLSSNIKQGNSLIEDSSIVEKLAFDWNKEFPEIMGNGGFDVVIGNPPYVRQERFTEIKPYLKKHYESYDSIADLYVYFIEKGIKLNRPGGSVSFILPNKFLRANYGEKIRNYIKSQVSIRKIYNFNDYPIFEDATTYPIIFIFDRKTAGIENFTYSEIDNSFKEIDPILQLEKLQYNVSMSSLTDKQWNFSNKGVDQILTKLKKDSTALKDIVDDKIFRGVSTGHNEVFIMDEQTKNQVCDANNHQYIRKIVTGKEVKRYSLSFQDKYLLFIPWEYKLSFSEKIKNYLEKHKAELEKRPEVKEGRFNWWCLSRYGSKNSEYLFKPKIIYPRINSQGNFYFDKTGEMSLSDNNFFISSDSLDLLAVLNSKLIFFYLKQICSTLQGGYLDFRRPYIETVPIKNNYYRMDLSKKANLMLELNKEFCAKKEKFLGLLKHELNLNKISQQLERFYEIDFETFIDLLKIKKLNLNKKSELFEFFEKNKKEILILKEKIEKTDKEIDQIVYNLYEITEAEKRIIEESLK